MKGFSKVRSTTKIIDNRLLRSGLLGEAKFTPRVKTWELGRYHETGTRGLEIYWSEGRAICLLLRKFIKTAFDGQ